MQQLINLISSIQPVVHTLEDRIQAHLDNLTKPRGSLGRLEWIAKRYCLIFNTLKPTIPRKTVFVFAGDHGVAEEGVSAFPKEVTAQMVYNFLRGGAGINVLARHAGAEVRVVDIGVDHDFEGVDGLIQAKVVRGTRNMTKRPAMSEDEVVKAVLVGVDLARKAVDEGIDLLATGEMGIANTTAASAITACICNKEPSEVTGRGTGVSEDTWRHKVGVIRRAIETNLPDSQKPLDVLAKVGGVEIAGICGLVLGAAAMKRPVVIDGFISTAGALVAYAMNKAVADYIFAAHRSVEQGHRIQLDFMGLEPLLDLDLRLGEGTGAALAMNLVDAGIKIYSEMATFTAACVSEGAVN
ncbi:MAG: nicotinate-nucleotide--dimethylbenzimidazole phosphoribosyltransferase [Dissulfuribacterales bacterium]